MGCAVHYALVSLPKTAVHVWHKAFVCTAMLVELKDSVHSPRTKGKDLQACQAAQLSAHNHKIIPDTQLCIGLKRCSTWLPRPSKCKRAAHLSQ